MRVDPFIEGLLLLRLVGGKEMEGGQERLFIRAPAPRQLPWYADTFLYSRGWVWNNRGQYWVFRFAE